MSIDPHSHIPIYEQIVDYIRGCVAAGVYRPGETLPSTRALALELVVNPNTVQRAYQELERQGLMYTRKGLGAFVTENGHASAQSRSETVILARFVQGIQLGRLSNIRPERIQTLFHKAMDTASDEPDGTKRNKDEMNAADGTETGDMRNEL